MALALDILILLGLFQIKHFIADFTSLQTPYMFLNKGNPKHPGGYLHAFIHLVCSNIAIGVAIFLGSDLMILIREGGNGWVIPQALLVEFVWHWITDLVKTDVVKVKGWKADKHQQFWTALGVDQLSHQICYLVMVAILIKPLL